MKLSYRDKVIFVAAIVIIILVAGFFLIIQPNMDKANVAKSNLATKETEKADVQAKLDTMPALVAQIHDLAKEIEESQKNYLEPMAPYECEQMLSEILNSCNVKVTSIATDYIVADDMIEFLTPDENLYSYSMMINSDIYNELPQEYRDHFNGIDYPDAKEQMLGITNITIEYGLEIDDFDMKEVWNYIDKIAEDERTMKILSVKSPERKELKPEDMENQDLQTGTINMQIYSIFPMNTEKVLQESDQIAIVEMTPEELEAAKAAQ